jgi:molybdate transport system substrate-binding protein
MKIRSLRIIAVPVASVASYLLLGATASGVLNAAEIKVLSGAVTKPVMNNHSPSRAVVGYKVTIDYEPTAGVLANAFKKAKPSMWQSRTSRRLQILRSRAGSPEAALSTSQGTASAYLCARRPKPDISSVEAFKRALLAAKSIAHADPARGGRTGVYVASLLDQLDIAAGIKSKITIFPPGVFDTIAKGDVEIGIGGISEIITDPRVELVGPLPAAIQNYNQFTAGIVASSKEQDAGQALIQYLTSPAAAAVWKAARL